jgi:hypothetical protein
VKDISFRVDFIAGNSQTMQKMGFKGKIRQALYVFTLGRMAQATLVGSETKVF